MPRLPPGRRAEGAERSQTTKPPQGFIPAAVLLPCARPGPGGQGMPPAQTEYPYFRSLTRHEKDNKNEGCPRNSRECPSCFDTERYAAPMSKYGQVARFERAASSSQRPLGAFFHWETTLFNRFRYENGALKASCLHRFHLLRTRLWSEMWSKRSHGSAAEYRRHPWERFSIIVHSELDAEKFFLVCSLDGNNFIRRQRLRQDL